MGVLDNSANGPSFTQNPGWPALQEEIAAGKAGQRAEDAARLDKIKAQITVAEITPGVSALGTATSEEELFVLRRKLHQYASLGWLIEKPLTAGEMSEIISLWLELGEKPFLDKGAFISLAEVRETERERQEGQIEVIRRLVQSSRVTISTNLELPETSPLGGKLDGEGMTFVLGGGFFEENPGFRVYFRGMLFNDAEKAKLIWFFDEMKPSSFVSVATLKEGLARKFRRGNGHVPHGTIGDRLPGVEDVLLQGHPDRHAVGPAPRREAKPRRKPKGEPNAGDDEDFVATDGRASGRKK